MTARPVQGALYRQCPCLRTVFTAGTFLAKASSSDLQMRLDIVVLAEDSEVTDLASSPTSSTH